MIRINWDGLCAMILLMLPNIAFALRGKEGFENLWHNRAVECLEQIGRFGCFFWMFLELPALCGGFWFPHGRAVCRIAGGALLFIYCAAWIVFWRREGLFRAAALSILPCALFLLQGILTRNLPLIAAALIFAPCHILLSLKNAVRRRSLQKKQCVNTCRTF